MRKYTEHAEDAWPTGNVPPRTSPWAWRWTSFQGHLNIRPNLGT